MPKTVKSSGREGGKRHPLNMRTTKATRDKLEAAASANGRSLAQEVETRLELSFAADAGFGSPEMRRLAYLMTTAFSAAAELRAAGKPDLTRDRSAYRAGMRGVLQALLIGMPDATEEEVAREFDGLRGELMSHFARRREGDQ